MEKHFFRTLIRVEDISSDQVRIVVPAWNPNLSFLIPLSTLPEDLKTALANSRIPYRFHAKANLAANEPQELELHDFQISVS